jgi:predicted AlkP superfamily pyrophosphatase or phosphodiesterase
VAGERTAAAWLGGILAVTLIGAGLAGAATAGTSAEPADTAKVRGSARHVIVISFDGLKPRTVRKLGRAGTPNLHRMFDEGAGTLNARTAVEQTLTLPNHASMLTGRRIDGPTGHHIDANKDPGRTIHAAAGTYRANLFDVVHDHGGSTALYASKDKFALFNRSWGPGRGARDRVGHPDGRDKIDDFFYRREPGQLITKVVRKLRRGTLPTATFVHVRLPDDAGHHDGFASAAYLDAVRRSDRMVGRVLNAIEAGGYRPSRLGLVVTSDHGGSETTSHGDRTDRANYRVPLVVWGAGAKPGAGLYALNRGRISPGVGRPGYGRPPIRNLDVASLATTLLGFPPVPGGLLPGTSALRVS